MDIRGFQVWLSAARGLTRAQRREALAVLSGRSEGEASKPARLLRPRLSLAWPPPLAPLRLRCLRLRRRLLPGSDRAWCGRGPALSALRERRGGFARYGAGSAALPVQGLRQDLQRAERYAAVGPAPQGTLAVVRGVAGEGGDGEGLGGALRRGGEHGIPLASPVSGGGAERFGGAQGDRGSGRDLRPGEPEGRARAGTQGTAAGRQGEEARPLARAGAGSHGGGPERDDGQRGAAQGRCGGARRSRLPSIRWSRRTPCWSPTAARATHLAPPRSG